MKKITGIGLVLFLFFACTAMDCDSTPRKQESASGAKQADPGRIRKNSRGNTGEQQNIEDRIAVTTDPTKVMWIHLIALDGKIIRRMPVRCKITSSGKRLEARHWFPDHGDQTTPPQSNGHFTDELIQPDGTFGESDAYVFWFDPMSRYHQWGTAGGLGYLLTDYPIDLQNPMDEITGMYNVQRQAFEWQQQQEQHLREQEGKK